MGPTLTEVEFHTGVVDPVHHACRLLRKAVRSGARLIVTAPPATLAALDRALWTFDERDFVAHVRLPGAPASVAARTPIWLAASRDGVAGAPPVMVNIGADAPTRLDGVSRLIEIVGVDADEVDRGRRRWRDFRSRGLAIVHHVIAERG